VFVDRLVPTEHLKVTAYSAACPSLPDRRLHQTVCLSRVGPNFQGTFKKRFNFEGYLITEFVQNKHYWWSHKCDKPLFFGIFVYFPLLTELSFPVEELCKLTSAAEKDMFS